MLIALSTTAGAPQTYKREITKATLASTLHRRISTLKYLKNVHLSKEPWLDTARIPREKLAAIYHPDFTRSYFALGANLGALSEIQYVDLRQFLNALQVVLHYFDYHDQKRITNNKMRRQKELKRAGKGGSGMRSDSISPAQSTTHSMSSSDSGSTTATPTSFRNPFKGRKIFGSNKKKEESVPSASVKVVTKKKSTHFGGLFARKKNSSHNNELSDDDFHDLHSDDDDDDDNLTPIISNTSSMATALATSAFRTNSRAGSSSGSGLFVTSTSTSSSSSSTAVSNSINEVHGTGTYTMGRAKKRYHQNNKADHSTINQNMLSVPSVPAAMQRTPMLTAVLDSLIVVDESNLPFPPDTIQAIITLLDLLVTIYRSLAQSLDQAGTLTRGELGDIDVALAGVEVILRRIVVSDALLSLDAEYLRLRAPRSRDLLERDILKHSSNPNGAARKPGSNGKLVDQNPVVAIPQSHAMYV